MDNQKSKVEAAQKLDKDRVNPDAIRLATEELLCLLYDELEMPIIEFTSERGILNALRLLKLDVNARSKD